MTWSRLGARALSGVITAVLVSGALACRPEPAPPLEYPSMPASTAAAPSTATKGAPGTEIAGEWVEFWALSGGADTQRYVFSPDGHFEWSAAESSKDAIVATFGAYTFDGSAIALTIKAERPRDSKCTDGCKKAIEPPRTAQLTVTECPPNEEARALDASYRCLSFGDRPFWLRARH
jgi:hypothetical protein